MGQNSPEYIHTVTEALKLGFADAIVSMAIRHFVKIPTQELLSKNYAAVRRSLIDEQKGFAGTASRRSDEHEATAAVNDTISYNAARFRRS